MSRGNMSSSVVLLLSSFFLVTSLINAKSISDPFEEIENEVRELINTVESAEQRQADALSFFHPAPGLSWYCGVSLVGGVQIKTRDLQTARNALGFGSKQNQQAIIPMSTLVAGDPHTLAKQWSTGSMWWEGWAEIRNMQAQCEREEVPDFFDCLIEKCHNGATCIGSNWGDKCVCTTGWKGDKCENACADNEPGCEGPDSAECQCENGGTCIHNIGVYECKCAIGWKGRKCENACVDKYPDECSIRAQRGLCSEGDSGLRAHIKKNCDKSCFCGQGPTVSWFCGVSLGDGSVANIIKTSRDLYMVQQELHHGSRFHIHSIIPMTGGTAGDPHDLVKNWGTGSMYWQNADEIRKMRERCAQVKVIPA